VFVALCGFFAGSTIPMYIVVTSTWFPQNTAFISLSYIVAGTVGRMIFPWLVTEIASVTNLGYALLVSSLMLFISTILIFMVQRISRNRISF
jgi:MFS family permease